MERKQPISKSKRLCNSLGLLLRQFFLILGKNFLLQFRRPIGTAVELLVPILGFGVIMVARVVTNQFDITAPSEQCFVTFPTDPLTVYNTSESFSNDIYDPIVYYAPDSLEVQPLADILSTKLEGVGRVLVGVATQEEFVNLSRATENDWCHGNIRPGIYFEDISSSDIKYTIRMRPDTQWNTDLTGVSVVGPRFDENVYLLEGFMQLEKLIDESIYQWKTNTSISFKVNARQFPYPNYVLDGFLTIIDFFLSLIFMISFIYTAGIIVKELVLEKETRIKETMKMMGLSNWILTSTWYLKEMMFLFIPIVIITIFFKYGQVYPLSNGFLILVFLMFYASAGIAFCFFVSVWFSSARLGLMAGMLGWFATYFPYLFLSFQYDTLNLATKVGVCFLPNTCVGLGAKVLSNLEIRNDGLTFSNFASPLSLDDEFNMGWVVLMLFIDTVLFMTLYWYIDTVKPGKYGTPKPFYFLFLPSYWCGKSTIKQSEVVDFLHPSSDANAHESEPTGLKVGISIQNLSKIYNRRNPRRRKVAVDSINLNMYEGQITALLGHNGAGKTTTMSMLTGLYTPTFGTAFVDGYDITTDMDLIRRNLGICPQHNVLFDRLTVAEHLMFFSLLKGLEAKKVRAEVDSMIEDLQLLDKRKTQSQKLSGGMKRKLSVGIALIGGSKIVVLDEPTSGMDPYARRGTWDLLNKHKQGRTMLLTTHFMDEADLLGDRVAIMAEGNIKCSGSSLFLKSRYGVGYHLTIVKEGGCDSLAVSGLVTQQITGAERVTDVGAELSFILPSQSIAQFPALFDLLEKNKTELGVSSFGVSITTMEEVFIKVGRGDDEGLLSRLDQQKNRDEKPSLSDNNHEGLEEQDIETQVLPETTGPVEQIRINMPPIENVNTGVTLWFQQFRAMFLKRTYNFIRFFMNILWQLVIPLVFVLLALVFAVTVGQDGTFGTEPSRAITLSTSALSDNRTFFWAQLNSTPGDLNLNFDNDDLDAVGVTNYVDYSNDILQLMRSSSLNSTTPQDCCNYRYQILDQFCATLDSADFVGPDGNGNICSGESFGYNPCIGNCLGCDIFFTYPTCSYPDGTSGTSNLCPVNPSYSQGNSGGPLEDLDFYVAERLLRLSGDDLNTNDFFLRLQGGYVVTSEVPRVFSTEHEASNTECVDDRVGRNVSFVSQPTLTVWYNNQPFHMAPASLNAFYSLLLRRDTGSDYTITVTNNPLPNTAKEQVESANNDPTGFAISTISIFGLSFLFASFILFPIEERSSKAKHIQFVSGVQASSYWIANYVFDMLNALVPCIIILIMFAAFNVDGYDGENLGAIFLLLVLTSWSAIPLTYIFSFVFSNPLIGFTLMILFHYLLALVFQIIVFIVTAFSSQDDGITVNYIFLIHPVYALGNGLSTMFTNQITKEACIRYEMESNRSCERSFADSVFEFKAPAIGHIFLYQFLEGLFFIVFTILIEREIFIPEVRTLFKNLFNSKVSSQLGEFDGKGDNDVFEERERVGNLSVEDAANKAVVIDNLSKTYENILSCKSKPKRAVRGINLIIPKGECFGLLGINGAGKTTTFKMLTGDISATGGTASISGFDIKTQLRQVQQRVGYCPQFDAIIDRLTGRELLTMFARLRGVPEKSIKRVVQTEIERLDLIKYANKRCGTYSGGNKRKLSTAIALVGDPPIVLLDEPTTGMDPATRRFLWNALIDIVRNGKSVILTTHSMEECEALCTRLAIMVNGQFKCLGSLQHLKSKFGAGFTMQIRVQGNSVEAPPLEQQSSQRSSFRRQNSGSIQSPTRQSPPQPQYQVDTTELKNFVSNKFPGAELLEEHQGAVTYRLLSEGLTWSYMFRTIEENRASFGIVDYSVSQTTLDQIFINFAKEQFSDD